MLRQQVCSVNTNVCEHQNVWEMVTQTPREGRCRCVLGERCTVQRERQKERVTNVLQCVREVRETHPT